MGVFGDWRRVSKQFTRRQLPDYPITQFPNSRIESFTAHGVGVDQEIRLVDQVQADRAHVLSHRVGELVMVPEKMEARSHRGQHFVDDSLASVDSAA